MLAGFTHQVKNREHQWAANQSAHQQAFQPVANEQAFLHSIETEALFKHELFVVGQWQIKHASDEAHHGDQQQTRQNTLGGGTCEILNPLKAAQQGKPHQDSGFNQHVDHAQAGFCD